MSERPPPIRILAVDDHPVLCSGRSALNANKSDLRIAHEPGSGSEVIARTLRRRAELQTVALEDIANCLLALQRLAHDADRDVAKIP